MMLARFALIVGSLCVFLAACSGTSVSATDLCPDPSTYCEGNTLVRCSTDNSGVIPEPRFSRTDCGASDRLCVPEPDGARCR